MPASSSCGSAMPICLEVTGVAEDDRGDDDPERRAASGVIDQHVEAEQPRQRHRVDVLAARGASAARGCPARRPRRRCRRRSRTTRRSAAGGLAAGGAPEQDVDHHRVNTTHRMSVIVDSTPRRSRSAGRSLACSIAGTPRSARPAEDRAEQHAVQVRPPVRGHADRTPTALTPVMPRPSREAEQRDAPTAACCARARGRAARRRPGT